jgi:hypothetical protein
LLQQQSKMQRTQQAWKRLSPALLRLVSKT